MVDINRIATLIDKHKNAQAAVAAVEKEIADLFAPTPKVSERTPYAPAAYRQNQIYAFLVSPQSTKKLIEMSGVSKSAARSAIRDLVAKKRIRFDPKIGKYRHA